MLPERARAPSSAWPELPVLLAIVLAVVMTWPFALHLGSDYNSDVCAGFTQCWDALIDTWQVAWIGHALLHQPLHLFQSNRFWPEPDSLAFNDAMLGYAPAGLIAGQGIHAALVVHNLLILFAHVLAFFGAYLLASELGAGRLGSIAAGAAFAYAPWLLGQVGLGLLSSGSIPLALFLLLRGYRRGSVRTVAGGWVVAAWQMSLGFVLGLQFAYLLLVLTVVVAILWLRARRPRIERALAWASVAGVCLVVLVTVLQARPYLRVRHDHPEAKRTPGQVAFFSPPPRGFLAAPADSFVWGGATAGVRRSLRFPPEQTFFPGATILLLALVGLLSAAYRPGLRIGVAAGTVVCGVLSLGLPNFPGPNQGFTPYKLLYDFAPGWDSVRTPGRLNNLTSLGLALLAGAGLSLLLQHAGRLSASGRPEARGAIRLLLGTALIGAILVEGFGPLRHPAAPRVPPGQLSAPAPQLHLPSADYPYDAIYSYWSTAGFPAIVNGSGSIDPTRLEQVRATTQSFPDAGSVAALRGLGVRTVILHTDLAFGTPWQDAAQRSIAGLPLTREDSGPLVLYHLTPGTG